MKKEQILPHSRQTSKNTRVVFSLSALLTDKYYNTNYNSSQQFARKLRFSHKLSHKWVSEKLFLPPLPKTTKYKT